MNRAKLPRWALALLLLTLSAPFWGLGHALVEVDDARYAEIPREMAETGDWATPKLDYVDYVEKPPLWYWLAASSYEVFGVSEATARLPLALLSAAGLLLTFWLGAWLYDERSGLLGAAALGSAGLYFFLSHYITLDLLLAVTLLAETALLLRCLVRPQDARWAAPAAWAAAALAFLSKGLVALVLPAGWLFWVWALIPAWRRRFLGLISPLGLALFAAVALPWFVLMERRHPGFLHFFFVEQHFQRFLTTKYNRDSGWYFFLLVLPAGMLPWTPAALAALARRPRAWREAPADLALALWVMVVLVFFSVSHSKLATYILPVVPHLALLAGRAADRELPRWSRRLSWSLGALLLAAGAAAPFVGQLPPEALPWAPAGAAALGAGLVAAGLLKGARERLLALSLGGLLIGACSLVCMSRAESLLSCKPLAQAVAARARPQDAVWAYDVYPQGLPFYLGRRVDKIIYWIGELHYAKRDPANAALFGDDSDVENLPLAGRRTFVALPSKEAGRFVSMTPQGAILDHARFGRWEVAEFLSAEQLNRPVAAARRRRRR